MYKLIQKNQKKLLAVFGVLLMIVFIIPPAAKYGSGRGDRPVAHIGKTPVYETELRRARDEWQWLNRLPGSFDYSTFRRTTLPESLLGHEVCQQIEQHPELFLLMQVEAEQHGSRRPSEDDAKSTLVNQFGFTFNAPDEHAVMVEGVRDLSLILAGYQRLADTIKVSEPVWRRDLQLRQQVRLGIVEFPASKLAVDLREPTQEQLEQQFHRYANEPRPEAKTSPKSDNPLRFGYQYPNRVKLQYIEIPHRLVARTIVGSPDLNAPEAEQKKYHEWAVKAAGYYFEHQNDFRTTPPATTRSTTAPATSTASVAGPATQLAETQPATEAVASTQPTTKPFAEVQGQIIDQLAEPEVQKKTQAIEQFILAQLNQDWQAIRKGHATLATAPTTMPSTQAATFGPTTQEAAAPITQPQDPAMTLARLQQIAEEVQQNPEFAGVLPSVHEIANDWQDDKALADLPGIGKAATASSTTGIGESFASYALQFAIAGQTNPMGLQLWQPLQPLTDPEQNAYVVRLTAAQPAHAPADMSEVGDQVVKDFKLKRAYELSKESAQRLLDAAKTSGLNQAAAAINEHPLIVGPFSPTEQKQRLLSARSMFQMPLPVEFPGYPLTNKYAQIVFLNGSISLLSKAMPQNPHPATLIELPTEAKVIVAELMDVELTEPVWAGQMRVTQSEAQQAVQKLAAEWFSYSAMAERLGYKPEGAEKQQGAS